MTPREIICRDFMDASEDSLFFIEGMDDALMGCTTFGEVVYQADRVIDIITEAMEGEEEAAIDEFYKMAEDLSGRIIFMFLPTVG